MAGQRGSVARDIIVWHWLREGFGSSGDVLVFLDHRPDWPGLAWLRRKSEPSFTNADAGRVLKFYAGMPPQTAEGALNVSVRSSRVLIISLVPYPWHEFIDAIDLVIRQSLRDPGEPCFGVDVVHPGGLDERAVDGGFFFTADGSHEQVVFAAKRDRLH